MASVGGVCILDSYRFQSIQCQRIPQLAETYAKNLSRCWDATIFF